MDIEKVLEAVAGLEPDPARASWLDARAQLDLISRELAGDVEGLVAQEPEDRREAAAQFFTGLLSGAGALLFASGDRSAGVALYARARALARGPDQAELHAAAQDPESFGVLVRARWLMRNGRRRDALRLLDALAKRAPGPVIREGIQRIRKAPRPLARAPGLGTYNGIGVQLIGRRDPRPDGSHVATTYFSVLFIPVIPLSAYRVIPQGGNQWLFLAKESLGPVGSSRVDLQACKLEYSIVSPK